MSKLTRWSPFALLALLPVLLLAVPLLSSAPKPAQDNGYVGMDQCAACHEETVTAFKETLHGKKGFEVRSKNACETCHGPGKAHVDAGGGKGSMKNPAALSKDEKSAMCLTCHDRGNKAMWAGSAHDSRGLACTSCHSVHKPQGQKAQLNAATESDLCFTCHKQKQSQFYRASHHPIREGKMECSSCHNPHGSVGPSLIDAADVNNKCFECHAEKRGPFLYEHIPVREDCANCHDPHGTNRLRLLKTKEPYLCQQCHADTRHPGSLYDQVDHDASSNRIHDRSCTNCHQQVHGSNHPSGNFFIR